MASEANRIFLTNIKSARLKAPPRPDGREGGACQNPILPLYKNYANYTGAPLTGAKVGAAGAGGLKIHYRSFGEYALKTAEVKHRSPQMKI